MFKEKKNELSDIRRILIQQVIAEDFQGHQSNFAEKVGKPVQQINNIIRNQRAAGDKVVLDIETALDKPVGWLSDSKNINQNFLNVMAAQEKFERDFEEIEGAFAQNLPANCVEIPIFNVDTVGQYVGGNHPQPINTTFSGVQAGAGLFGFLMPDDSMFDPNAAIFFNKDDVLIISPEIKNLHSSDCALVQLKQPEQTFIIAQFYNNIRGQYFKQHQESEILTFDNIEQVIGMVVEKQKTLFDSAILQQKLANQ